VVKSVTFLFQVHFHLLQVVLLLLSTSTAIDLEAKFYWLLDSSVRLVGTSRHMAVGPVVLSCIGQQEARVVALVGVLVGYVVPLHLVRVFLAAERPDCTILTVWLSFRCFLHFN